MHYLMKQLLSLRSRPIQVFGEWFFVFCSIYLVVFSTLILFVIFIYIYLLCVGKIIFVNNRWRSMPGLSILCLIVKLMLPVTFLLNVIKETCFYHVLLY